MRNDASQLTGVALRKYETLYHAVINLLTKDLPGNGSRVLNVPRGRYKAPINPVVKNLIGKFIDSLQSEKFAAVTAAVLEAATTGRAKAISDPEKYIGDVTEVLRDTAASEIVHPLLAVLEKPLTDSAYSAIESAFEIETELVSALTDETARQMPDALNALTLKSEDAPLKAVLAEFFDEAQARQHLKDFFDGFSTADAWQEVRDLNGLTRMAENQQLYLYIGDLRFANSLYPVVYIPLTVTQDDESGDFRLELDAHLYVNKRAIEFVAQELELSIAHQKSDAIDDRILYLEPGAAPAGEIDRIFARLQSLFDLDCALKLSDGPRAAKSSRVRLSTAAYFAVFDRSDEALLNDYEALLSELRSEPDSVGSLFEKIIHGFLLDNPIDVGDKVRQFWDGLEVPGRLVTESPIPLNEEQRKALTALENPEVNFVTIQGPPGTGKSHTVSAIAFDCILKGRTVLVLSDKTEALDVVENKLTQAINQVRPNEDFRNPILRLGRTGGNYATLLSHASIARISDQYHATASRRREIEQNICSARETLERNIRETIQQLSQISLDDIEGLQKLEEIIGRHAPEVVAALEEGTLPDLESQLNEVLEWQRSGAKAAAVDLLDRADVETVGDVLRVMRKATLGSNLGILAAKRKPCSIFRTLRPGDGRTLQQLVARYDELRMPLFGYLFRRGKVRKLNAEVADRLPVENFLDLHRRLADLRGLCELLPKAEAVTRSWGASDEEFSELYEAIVHRNEQFPDSGPMLHLMGAIGKAFSAWNLPSFAGWKIGEGGRFAKPTDALGFGVAVANLVRLWKLLTGSEAKVPIFDYVAERDELQQLCAAKMTFEMDGRFVRFCNESAATARVLAAIIRKKQKFPTENFTSLRDAFPCIIASVREFAEYIPLQTDMFDLVVIDEASQVSVAQALPALLRAKKVLVLGDENQFSNVKSAYASNERNTAYVADLLSYFRTKVSDRSGDLERVAKFNVKNSVLDFFEFIRNYNIMLRKHFRGYQELISFSSDYFYGKRLQAVKLRGKPIEEVIKFTEVEHDGRPEKYRNTNSIEAEFILEQLDQFLEMEKPPTVGVITPFREQVALLSRLVLERPNARDYQDALRLKIMTFDTCQGEEREIILYSMVATREHDALNYIFPVDMTDAGQKVAGDLRFQRLNVGFSRAQECIHFVLSKPVEEFPGSILAALNHYRRILEEKDKADPGNTDPNSPMEKRLLGWLRATQFYQENRDSIELRPQFPIGEYLRQLDPGYHHPKYRVDFLLTYRDDEESAPVNVVIEYDGFKEHFVETERVNQGNWAFYYKPEDVERQVTLESYGYKFLRVNRFNLGSDPVNTLSDRLQKLLGTIERNNNNHKVVDRIQDDAAALANGEKKFCRKCQKTKPLKAFFDKALRGGTGSYGRYCLQCKQGR